MGKDSYLGQVPTMTELKNRQRGLGCYELTCVRTLVPNADLNEQWCLTWVILPRVALPQLLIQ